MNSTTKTVDVWLVAGMKFLSEREAVSAACRIADLGETPVEITKGALTIEAFTVVSVIQPRPCRVCG
ncbi:hypothetical protein [Schlesneria sp. T3-172]|uniref:hypothetical protein n=1 Tax=Schlesneria sphaerica TaxID=3373610 RepID=UPI0037C56BC3